MQRPFKDGQYHGDYEIVDIKTNLKQQIQQLRTYCIKEKKDQMVGVITNSKDWIFTRYDMKAEVEAAKFGFEKDKKRFEYSQKFEIFHLDKRTNSIEIKYTELA